MPTLHFDAQEGLLEFSGQCLMKHIWQITVPVFEWTNQYLASHPANIRINFKLTYFNIAGAKFFWNFFRLLDKYCHETGNTVELYWFFDQDDLEMWKLFESYAKEVNFCCHHIHQTEMKKW